MEFQRDPAMLAKYRSKQRDPKLAPAYAERVSAAATASTSSSGASLSPAVEQAVEEFYRVLGAYQPPSSEDPFACVAVNPCYMRNPRDFGDGGL
jgi:hypothetical protein